MTLILLTISGILALNAVLEAHAQGLFHIPGMGTPAAATAGGGVGNAGTSNAGARSSSTSVAGLKTEVGVIEQVDFYDAPVGQPNKSFVQIRGKGEKTPHTLVLEGNVRGLLIPGRRMELAYKPQARWREPWSPSTSSKAALTNAGRRPCHSERCARSRSDQAPVEEPYRNQNLPSVLPVMYLRNLTVPAT